MQKAVNDTLLSLLTGIALLVASRAAYDLFVGYLPDTLLMSGTDPLGRLALARLVLFALLVFLLAVPLSWPLARHAANKALNTTLPGAACGLVLFLMLERLQFMNPFPPWLDFARAAVLFAAVPSAALFWWRLRREAD